MVRVVPGRKKRRHPRVKSEKVREYMRRPRKRRKINGVRKKRKRVVLSKRAKFKRKSTGHRSGPTSFTFIKKK